MSCYKVLTPTGETDPRFEQLLTVFNGDENKALDAFVREAYFGERLFDFSVSGSKPVNSKDFLENFFAYDDAFYNSDAVNIRNKKFELVERTVVNGQPHFTMYDIHGKPHTFPEADLDKNLETYIKEKEMMHNNILQSAFSIAKFPDFRSRDKLIDFVKTIFQSIDISMIDKFFRGLNLDLVKKYSDMAGTSIFIDSLKDENIMIHEKEKNGVKTYDLLFPSITSKDRSKFGKNQDSWMSVIFKDKVIAKKKGFTIKNNNLGKKQIMAAILVLQIKRSDPTAKINSARFGDFSFQGEALTMDIYEAIHNLRNAYRNQETRDLLPAEIFQLLADTDTVKDEEFIPNAVEILLSTELDKKARGEIYQKNLVTVLESNHTGKMIAAINRRIHFLTTTFTQKNSNGKFKYEDPEDVIGKEILVLAKAKEQLHQHSGLDRRTLNFDVKLGNMSRWFKSLGDFQNSQMQLVFQEFRSVMFKIKQDFEKFRKQKDKAFQEYYNSFSDANGAQVKNRTFNYTQDLYKNLFETVKVRKLENGVLSTDMVDANIVKLKDPDDTSNGLKDFERKFIRVIIAMHRKSIVDFINRKIENGEIDAQVYQDGDDWYQKEYQHAERLLPVMAKSSGTQVMEGDFWNSVKTSAMEAGDFLEIGVDGFQSDRRHRPFGSATMQRQGNIRYGRDERIKKIGLDVYNNELVMIDPEKNKRANLDVEQIIHSSVFQNFKSKFEHPLIATLVTAKIILAKRELDENVDKSIELKTLQTLFDNLIYGERQELNQFGTNLEAPLDFARKKVGTFTLMVHFNSALLTLAGSFMGLASNAVSMRFGPEYFNGKNLAKAAYFAIKNQKKFGDIVDMFLFHDKSETSLVHSGKYKENQKGFFQDHHKLLLHSLADRFTKGLLLCAQLDHEGLLENFEYDSNEELIYNWSKDKRKKAIQDHIRNRNAEQEKDDLPYDDVLINTLTTISAKIFGAMSDEEKNLIMTHGAAQFFAQFKQYIVARGNELAQTGFENQNIAWYSTDENGEIRLTPYYQEGMINTVVQYGKELARLKWNPTAAWAEMRPEQKRNFRKIGIDVTFFAMGMMLYTMATDDEDDEEWKKKFRTSAEAQYLKFAVLDMIGIYNIADYTEAVSPAVFTYMERVVDAMVVFANGDFQKGSEKSVKLFGVGKSAYFIKDLMED